MKFSVHPVYGISACSHRCRCLVDFIRNHPFQVDGFTFPRFERSIEQTFIHSTWAASWIFYPTSCHSTKMERFDIIFSFAGCCCSVYSWRPGSHPSWAYAGYERRDYILSAPGELRGGGNRFPRSRRPTWVTQCSPGSDFSELPSTALQVIIIILLFL